MPDANENHRFARRSRPRPRACLRPQIRAESLYGASIPGWTILAVLGQGLRSSDRNTLNGQVRADYVLTSQNGFDQFSGDAVRKLPAVPGVSGRS